MSRSATATTGTTFIAAIAFLCCAQLMPSCAHAPVTRAKVVAPVARRQAEPWTGLIRLAAGSDSPGVQDNQRLVTETVQGLVAHLGIRARVECLSAQGDVDAAGAVHARVRVQFLDPLSAEQELQAIRALQSLKPNADAYSDVLLKVDRRTLGAEDRRSQL